MNVESTHHADNKNAEGKIFENIEDATSFWIELWKSQGSGNRNI